jgi:hypothetical protein
LDAQRGGELIKSKVKADRSLRLLRLTLDVRWRAILDSVLHIPSSLVLAPAKNAHFLPEVPPYVAISHAVAKKHPFYWHCHIWNRSEAAELAKLYALATPHYAAVIESYQKAQDVARQAKP